MGQKPVPLPFPFLSSWISKGYKHKICRHMSITICRERESYIYSLVSSKGMYVCMEGKQSMYSMILVLGYEQIASKICVSETTFKGHHYLTHTQVVESSSLEIFEIRLDIVLGTLLWVSLLGTNVRKSDEVAQPDDAIAHAPVVSSAH